MPRRIHFVSIIFPLLAYMDHGWFVVVNNKKPHYGKLPSGGRDMFIFKDNGTLN